MEIANSQSHLAFKYRLHDSRIGRFLSIDPLAPKYPFYSAYSISGNRVIDANELEGLEPSKNTDINNPDSNFRAAAADVCIINDAAQNANESLNGKAASRLAGGLKLWGKETSERVGFGLSNKREGGSDYVSDTNLESANKYNMWVNALGTFTVDESQAATVRNYNLFVATVLLNNFATGAGPENYVFPEDGKISSSLKTSYIVQNALEEFISSGKSSLQQQYTFDREGLQRNLATFRTPFNVEGLIGSGTINMVKTETSIKVTIFNVTSLYSGAYSSKMPRGATIFSPPVSNVRNPNAPRTYYGNISQTFSFNIPMP